ncbi:MAG: Nif11-like leader peptide family natural product precursor [Fibrobacter sp.]|nr:Nif11-like leader peptide family natural product precursor [Fibrobacter sp.]
MSLEQAQDFIERMKMDKAFWAKVMAAQDVAGRLSLAKANGYDFDQEEIKSVSAAFDESDQAYVTKQYSRCDCDDCDHWSHCG